MDDDEEEEEEDSGWEAGRGVGVARRRTRRRVNVGGGDVDEGYEADFIDEEEEEELESVASWEQRRMRRSALCRLEGGEETAWRRAVERLEETPEDKVDVAAAVRLRKEVRRARRLAGQPSAAVLRRKGANVPLPALRIDGAAV